jgi:hypothetical protein
VLFRHVNSKPAAKAAIVLLGEFIAFANRQVLAGGGIGLAPTSMPIAISLGAR